MSPRQRRILNRLTRDRVSAEDGYTCGRTLQHPSLGGQRYAARVHELRQSGVALERRYPCRCGTCEYHIRQAQGRGEQPPYYAAWRLAEVEGVGA